MAAKKTKFTYTALHALKPKAEPYFVGDTLVSGLRVRVTGTAEAPKRSISVAYREKIGHDKYKQRSQVLGDVVDLIRQPGNVELVRDQAREIIRAAKNPDRAPEKQRPQTVREFAEVFVAERTAQRIDGQGNRVDLSDGGRQKRQYLGIIVDGDRENGVKGLGEKRLEHVTPADIDAFTSSARVYSPSKFNKIA